MAEDVNVKVIKRTQDKLGKYIKKPPLQEKLLKRPPFRFIHDIITNVIKSTSLLKGLYTPEELISDNVKEKESKIKFLQKAVDAIMFVTGDTLSVKPSKVVAGHEAEKTNEFLQCIAKAIRQKMDSSDAVQRVLNGEKPSNGDKKSPEKKQTLQSPAKESPAHNIPSNDIKTEENDTSPKKVSKSEHEPKKVSKSEHEAKKDSSKSLVKSKDRTSSRRTDKSKERSPSKTRHKEEKSKDRVKDKSKSNHSSRNKDRHREDRPHKSGSSRGKTEKIGSPSKNKSVIRENSLNNENIDSNMAERDENDAPPPTEDSVMMNGHLDKDKEDTLNDRDGSLNDINMNRSMSSSRDHRLVTPRPPSAKGPRRRTVHSTKEVTPKHEKVDDVSDSPGLRNGSASKEPMPPPPTAASMRSARPTSRNVRSARPSSARPAPPKIRQRDIVEESQVRPESVKPPSNIILQDDDENEDETFLVEEAPKAPPDLPQDDSVKLSGADAESEEQAQGRLVKQLLETKKDLEGGSQRETMDKVEVEKPFINTTQKRKEREVVSKEIEKLRSTIQTLTRSANPLGKLMDYLQEDIDSMQKEWKMWNEEYYVNNQALKHEQSLTENSLEPLQNQLLEIDKSIEDQQDKIHNVKSKMLHNEEKLQKILSSINFSSK